jgi:hypothetical protein
MADDNRGAGPGPHLRFEPEDAMDYFDAAMLELTEATSMSIVIGDAAAARSFDPKAQVGALRALTEKLDAAAHYARAALKKPKPGTRDE